MHQKRWTQVIQYREPDKLALLLADMTPLFRVMIERVDYWLYPLYDISLQQFDPHSMTWVRPSLFWGTKPFRQRLTRRAARRAAHKMLGEATSTWEARP